ncbi:hypothetical protein WA538_004067 [Blastocystis sp. DL]
MNPFSGSFSQSVALPTGPLLLFSDSSSEMTDNSINHDYAASVQSDSRFITLREHNYYQMLTNAINTGLPHSVVYKTQLLIDYLFSRIQINPVWYPLVSKLCSYIALSYDASSYELQSATFTSPTIYASLLKSVRGKYQKDKEWLDYAIGFILLIVGPVIACDSPHAICYRLLQQIHFEYFVPYVEVVIDNLCTRYASLSLSAHTIAYLSILTTMKYYYGERTEYDIIPEQPIPERERDLCLCLISSLYKHLHHVCVELSKQTDAISISSRDKCITPVPSPKEIYAATYST